MPTRKRAVMTCLILLGACAHGTSPREVSPPEMSPPYDEKMPEARELPLCQEEAVYGPPDEQSPCLTKADLALREAKSALSCRTGSADKAWKRYEDVMELRSQYIDEAEAICSDKSYATIHCARAQTKAQQWDGDVHEKGSLANLSRLARCASHEDVRRRR